jgi:hypothetical protein
MGALACILSFIQPLSAQVQGQWTATGAMQSPRESNAQAPIRGGYVLTIGGNDGNGNILSTAEIFRPTSGAWNSTGSMQAARENFPAVVLANGKVLVSGGLSTGGVLLTGAELFDPSTNAWTAAGNLSVARFGHTATLLANGKVLVTGGCTASDCSTITGVSEIYNPTTNSWSTTGSLNIARTYHTAVLLNTGAVLVVGGNAAGATSSCESYNPSTGKWTAAASTTTPRYLNGTTRLPDGKVLVTGGTITRYPMNSTELYDPVGNTWMPTGSMRTGRYAHSSTLLSDGTVLVAGGEGQSISCGKDCTGYIPTAAAEIYNEAAGTFSAAAPLTRALAYQASSAMANGRALVNGGSGYNAYCCQVVTNTEFYTPLTMSFSSASLNFGFIQIGLTSSSQAVTVTNVSGHSAVFTGIAASGDFAQTNTCPGTLEPTQSCTITITFTPTVSGNRSGAVTLQDNDPGSPRQIIALTGVGETLALAFESASLKMGSVVDGSSSAMNATLVNDGSSAVNITAIAISPKNHTFTQTNNCPTTLYSQQSCVFQIVFTPPDIANYKATLSVANSAGAAATLKLSGTGLDGPQARR